MKRFIPIVLSLLLLTACGGRAAPSSQGNPSSGGGLVVSQLDGDLEAAPEPSEPDTVPESPSDSAPETQRNQTVEAMIQDFKGHSKSGPSLADAKPNGMDLYFTDGTVAHVPIPGSGPGFPQGYAASLREDAVVIACRPEDDEDAVVVVSTVDRGQSWQSANLEVTDAGKYHYSDLSFRDAEKGVLALYEGQGQSGLIFATENGGVTWSTPIPLPAMEALYGVIAAEDGFCIVGEIKPYPIILRSHDGVDWNKITLPLDMEEYTEGYCVYAAFSGDTGLAVVVSVDVEENTKRLYFASEDGGQSWFLYEN